jgi:hypothetical protein
MPQRPKRCGRAKDGARALQGYSAWFGRFIINNDKIYLSLRTLGKSIECDAISNKHPMLIF